MSMRLDAHADSHCRECGAHVSDSFARVFGDNDDVVHGCPNCETYAAVFDGAAATEVTQS